LFVLIDVEEVPCHMGEHQALQPTQVIKPVVKGFLDRFDEGLMGISALEFQESSHLSDASSGRVFLNLLYIVVQLL
jgi:hypothetical protein